MAENEGNSFETPFNDAPRPSVPASSIIVALCPDDFQRIGLQPRESRLTVIRRAAMRTTKSLASKQLSAPSRVTEHQLSRVALSTYRLLDPRQRLDAKQRVHVGRIRRGTLLLAEKAAFADGRILIRSIRYENQVIETDSSAMSTESLPVGTRYESSPSAEKTSAEATGTGLRHRLQQPAWIVLMIVIVLCATVALWIWGKQNRRTLPRPRAVGQDVSS
ncbi:MAG: hypothetical protein AAFX06_05810 [Planctomycetota bacterium]